MADAPDKRRGAYDLLDVDDVQSPLQQSTDENVDAAPGEPAPVQIKEPEPLSISTPRALKPRRSMSRSKIALIVAVVGGAFVAWQQGAVEKISGLTSGDGNEAVEPVTPPVVEGPDTQGRTDTSKKPSGTLELDVTPDPATWTVKSSTWVGDVPADLSCTQGKEGITCTSAEKGSCAAPWTQVNFDRATVQRMVLSCAK